MSFKLENFGADSSNAKSTLGGVRYYRYFNEDNNTLTNAGYFPANLGLEVGDRIRVIPAVKTNADELYVVTSTANRTVTVTQIDTDGAVDSVNGKTGHVVLDANDVGAVPQYVTMPPASELNAGTLAQFKGTTDATYTHGYIYECVATPVYDATVQFNPATLSSTTAACSGSDFAALVARWGTGAIDTIIKGTLTYDESGELLVFVGQDDTDTQVCTFQLYVQDYVDAGFTFTGTFQDGDVIAFTCTIEETGATYAWVRQDVQPQPAKELPTQAGNSGKFLKTNGVSASWENVGSLPDQTGQSGKFLTTDGTDASWDSINALQNTATGNQALTILGTATNKDYSTNVGVGSVAGGQAATALGRNAKAEKDKSIAIGAGAKAASTMSIVIGNGTSTNYGNKYCLAIGHNAFSAADHAIQLGTDGTREASGQSTANGDTNTFKVANENGNFEIMNANGNLPADRLASTTGLADGNYRLRLTMASGVPTLTWVAE